jgi:hypothetical protein
LTWNDFKNDTTTGTTKDLDLLVIDSRYQKVYESSRVQVLKDTSDDHKKFSIYPREHVTADLAPGNYYLMVKSTNVAAFGGDDKLRITVDGEYVNLKHYDLYENILNPADNPSVITVGALDSERTGVSIKLRKPELLTKSLVKTTDGLDHAGSSNSAAIVAAGFGLLKSLNPSLTRQDLLNATSSDSSLMNGVFSLPQPK